METAIWIAQVVLASVFAFAGALKLTQPREKLVSLGQGWVEDFDDRRVKSIGVLEVLTAIGLILPAALDIAPTLTAVAAVGAILLMVGAAATHVRRREFDRLPLNVALAALAVFVAAMRFGPHSL
jgi:uncharacterized membrane protein YphA (DoxX/SURF4 family)